jgi:CHAT domain-containing protein
MERAVPGSQRRVLLRDAATYARLYDAVDRPRYLHLATHGVAVEDRMVFESGLLLSPSARGTTGQAWLLSLGDLLQNWSGKLQGTELVVLSACQSARGELLSGEGIAALPWGFMYAGASGSLGTCRTTSSRKRATKAGKKMNAASST